MAKQPNTPTPLRLAASRKEPKPNQPTQRELDQQTTLDTFRLLLSAIIRKHGTLDVISLTREEIQTVGSGDLRVMDDPTHVHLSIRVGKTGPFMGGRPRLITPGR